MIFIIYTLQYQFSCAVADKLSLFGLFQGHTSCALQILDKMDDASLNIATSSLKM